MDYYGVPWVCAMPGSVICQANIDARQLRNDLCMATVKVRNCIVVWDIGRRNGASSGPQRFVLPQFRS
jgi:hypothetical protein